MATTKSIGVHFYIRESRKDKDGNCPIYIRLIADKERAVLSTGKSTKPKSWNKSKERLIGKDAITIAINQHLDILHAKVLESANQLAFQGKGVSVVAIKRILSHVEQQKFDKSIISAIDAHNEEMKALIGTRYAHGNYKNYKTTAKYLKKFILYELKIDDILLEDLEPSFAKKFETWLLLNTPSNNNGTMKHIQRLKKIINRAIQYGWVKANPFVSYKVVFDRHDRGYLTESEVDLIKAASFKEKSLNLIRDLFLFQIYTGLAYTDISSLRKEHIVLNYEGADWIVKTRDKSKVKSMIPLLPYAKAILERYKQADKVFDVPVNQTMNRNLKVIAQHCGINKRLTTHLARHTFATTITLNKGVPIETVSKMLGHTKISTTQIYSKITANKIAKDMAIIIKNGEGD